MTIRKTTQKVEISVSTLSAWLWVSVGNMLVWCYVLSVVLRHLNIRQDLQTPGDVFAFGVTLAMTVLAVVITMSLGIARLSAGKQDGLFQ